MNFYRLLRQKDYELYWIYDYEKSADLAYVLLCDLNRPSRNEDLFNPEEDFEQSSHVIKCIVFKSPALKRKQLKKVFRYFEDLLTYKEDCFYFFKEYTFNKKFKLKFRFPEDMPMINKSVNQLLKENGEIGILLIIFHKMSCNCDKVS